MATPRLAALWRWLAILLLIAMGATGLQSATGSWPHARGAGQRVQSASQFVYSVSALSATIAAALAPVVWGGTSWWTGAIAALAAAGIAWLVSHPFR